MLTSVLCQTALMGYGQRVAHERKRRGWTRVDLAEKVGSSAETIKRLENSDYPPKRSQFTAQIAHVLGVHADDPEGARRATEPAGQPARWDLSSVPEAVLATELARRVVARSAGEPVMPGPPPDTSQPGVAVVLPEHDVNTDSDEEDRDYRQAH